MQRAPRRTERGGEAHLYGGTVHCRQRVPNRYFRVTKRRRRILATCEAGAIASRVEVLRCDSEFWPPSWRPFFFHPCVLGKSGTMACERAIRTLWAIRYPCGN